MVVEEEGCLCLLNPATKEYKRIPDPEILAKRPPYYVFKDYGFGYSPRTDEYKVVVIRGYKIEENIHNDSWVYTLGTNSSWRLIEGSTYWIHTGSHALVNGALHWMAISDMPGFSILLISFDLGDEKFRLLSLPKSLSQEDINHMGLLESDGFLSLCHWMADGKFDVWIMKDYGDEQS
ncbi:hypothetical protein NE237_004690 [Protea cynaroides]|uniref:F-box associated beta-propeller type 3 domain-containing protein n=1 Tax=Protea cynaroides TaxID=273540 RepID=A0A9Q0KJD9_9MAGN|nr:hypothetical protein NE237_004690 [Protea cynaroides]